MEITPWDGGTKLYENTLDVRGAIHEVIAANVANEETPGYRAMQLPFQTALDAALKGNGPMMPTTTHPRHVPLVFQENNAFLQVLSPATGSGPDGNTVNLEQEMTRMAENSLMYMTVSQFLAGRFNGWRSAINEGR